MSALAALLSAADAAKRRVKDVIQNPIASAEMSADELLNRLRRDPQSVALDLFNPSAAVGAGALGIVKNKGGNWLTGSVEDALAGLKRANVPDPALGGNPNDPRMALGRWIEGPLTKYVKTRMATPEDEVRKLAEEGILHVNPEGLQRPRQMSILDDLMRRNRAHGGFPEEGVASSQLAKDWETASDASLGSYSKDDLGIESLQKNPWIEKISDQDRAYDINTGFTGRNMDPLGFPHLIDELSNALNPASGLPRNLLLSPEAIDKMSMEKAVRRVADINAWRAAQKAEANRALAEKAMAVREYAENNPKGLRWVELKAPETSWKEGEPIPEGFSLSSGRKPGTFIAQHSGALESSGTHPSAEAAVNTILRKRALQDQLKYEGDTMGHCVGGYCDDVLSGRSRIFSLRDAKGEPHVTVEVDPASGQYEEMMEGKAVPRITQIKGKQNKAPNPEYLPFVQDFVRNSPLGSPWSEVGDLANTGLYHKSTLTPAERDLVQSDYLTMDDIKKLREGQPWTPIDTDPEFASGGTVTAPQRPRPIVQPGTETSTLGTRGHSDESQQTFDWPF